MRFFRTCPTPVIVPPVPTPGPSYTWDGQRHLVGAVTPVPDTLSEYQFAGLLRGSRTELVDTQVGESGLMLQAPATAEIGNTPGISGACKVN